MDVNILWKECLNKLENIITSTVSFNIYLKEAVPLSFNNDILIIAVKMSITKNMIENRYKEIIEKVASDICDANITLEIVINQNIEELVDKIKEKNDQTFSLSSSSNLNPRYTFENYIIGSSNEYATATAIRVAEEPGTVYNPLFLYGNCGLGKTHLMHAIGNKTLKNNPSAKVVYITSEKFVNDFIENVRKKTPREFREKYRHADVLLIDDVQFLAKKEQTQDELFHTFNALYDKNKQIVITSDRQPKDLITLSERLVNRFEQGPIIDITAPSLETRIAILKNKVQYKNLDIDDDVFTFIAECVQSNVRELEGALLKIISYSQIKERKINLELAEECLKSYLKNTKVNIDTIISHVCDYYEIKKEDLIGKTRTKTFTYPRQVAMYLANHLTELNYGAIAKSFGNRDRTSIMHNVEKIKDEINKNQNLKSEIEYITKELKN